MQDSTKRLASAMAAISLVALTAVGCSGDDDTTSGGDTRSENATETDVSTVAAPGSFELTTADGSVAVAGSVEDCNLIDDSSATIRFTGSVVDVTVDASGGTGGVTVVDGFEGTIDSAVIDLESGAVRIEGEGSSSVDETQLTRFEVEGTCAV